MRETRLRAIKAESNFAFDAVSSTAVTLPVPQHSAEPLPQAAGGVSFLITPISQTISEGGDIKFKISVINPNYPSVGSYKIYWRTNATADHAASASDYDSVSSLQTLTFSASSAQFYTITVHTKTDSAVEGTEYFEVDLYDFQGFYLSGSATVFSIFDVPPSKPDIAIGNVSISVSSVQPGGGFTVSAWIFNDGNATAGASTAKLYLSRDGSIDSNDTLLGTFSIPSLVPGDRSDDFGKSVLLPSNWPTGTSYIIVDADTSNAVVESNEANNSFKRSFTVAAPTSVPDLQIGNLTVTPTSVQMGGGFTVSAWIFNNGNAIAGASTAKLYLSRDGTIDSSDFLIGTFSISSLAAGGRSSDFGRSVLLPSGWQSGTSYVIVDADTANVVNESNDANNSFKTSLAVTAPTVLPDLAIGDLSLGSSTALPGSTVSVTFSVVNSGGATAGASSAHLYMSRDQYFDPGDVPIGSTISIPSLTLGGSVSRTATVQIPSNWAASASYIIVVADVGGVLTETSEANNSWKRMITISESSGATPASGPNAVIPYDDQSPYTATASEIAEIARKYVGVQWGAENCTGFVWLIADQATRDGRTRYFDNGDHYIQNGTKVIDAGFTMGYDAPGPGTVSGDGDNPTDHWSPISNASNYKQTDWFSVVVPGDIVRVTGGSFSGGVHSFVVSRVEGSGGSRRVWIIDNTGDDPSDPSLARIREYEVGNTSFQQALRAAPNVWVQRLDGSVATTASNVASGASWTDGSDVRELVGGPAQDVLSINAAIGSAGTFALAGNSIGKVLLSNSETGFLLLTADEFEEIQIYGGMGDNRLLIGSLEGTDVAFSTVYFFGRDGSDVVDAYGTDRRIVVAAGSGTDRLTGGAGDDILDGGAGVDSMAGGLGNDSYFVDNSNDWVLERVGEGSLDIIFTSVSYSMAANIYVEILSTDSDVGTAPISLAGNELDNVIRGNAGDNNLFGLGGVDELVGLGGNDNYVLDNPLDRVVESAGAGHDTVFSSVSYALAADTEVEVLTTADANGTATINLTGNSVAQQIFGNAGANVLDGMAGNDVLIGGAGADIARFHSAQAANVIVAYGGTVAVFNAANHETDWMQQIETLQFDNLSLPTAGLPEFPALDYIATYDDLSRALGANAEAGFAHFVNYGFFEGRTQDGFDGFQYLAAYDDLIRAFGADERRAAEHFIAFGLNEGRVRDGFDGLQYLATYDDLIRAFGPDEHRAAGHFIAFGLNEGRTRDGFDGMQYLASYDDLIRAFGADDQRAAQHFISFGLAEGRVRDSFDGLQYVAGYDDLIHAFGTDEHRAAEHFLTFGFNEGRARDSFDGLQYIASYGDLIRAFGVNEHAGAQHFISFGSSEGRARDTFDAAQYLANYSDLRAAFGNDEHAAVAHFITYGYFEGRTDDPLFGG